MKISNLPVATSVNDEDVVPVVQGGKTKKLPRGALKIPEGLVLRDGTLYLIHDGDVIGVGADIPIVTVDQTYNSKSTNPQSGVAVAEAVSEAKTYADGLNSIANIKINRLNDTMSTVQEKVTTIIKNQDNVNLENSTTEKISFTQEDGKLIATVKQVSDVTLDSIAYEDKTYREIFIDNNLTSWGDFESGIDGVTVGAGSPEVVSDVYNSGSYSLKVVGETSQQLKQTSKFNETTLYGACYGRVDRYVQGNLGLQIAPGAGTIVTGALKEVTTDFERLSVITTITAENTGVDFYCGSMNSANLDGYVDDVVFVDLSIFSTIPSKETMDTLYDNYIKLITYGSIAVGEEVYTISGEEIVVDDEMSGESENPVQNKVAKAYVDNKNNLKFIGNNSKIVSFKEQDGKLVAVTNELASGITLDSIAYEDKTYRDIFITSEIFKDGDFENVLNDDLNNLQLSQYSATVGNPTITTEASNTGNKSLKCFGSTSQQVVRKFMPGAGTKSYYIGLYARIDRLTAGALGVELYVNGSYYNKLSSETNSEFILLSSLYENIDVASDTVTARIYVGSMNSANLDGYLDDIVVVDLSSFSTIPDQATMDELYKTYVQLVSGEPIVNGDGFEYVIGEEARTQTEYTDLECFNAFVEKMNEKATQLGMTNTIYTNANGGEPSNSKELVYSGGTLISGVNDSGVIRNGNRTTAQDLIRVFMSATSYNDLARVWNKKTKTIITKGGKSVTVNTTVSNSNFTDYYILGGKTGSISYGDGTSVTALGIVGEIDDKVVVGVVMGSENSNARFIAMDELFDATKEVLETDSTTKTVTNAKNVCSCLLPEHNINLYEQYPFNFLYEQAEDQVDGKDVQYVPASTTKVMTSLVMLDYIKDLDETIEFTSFDLNIGGSGKVFEVGDVITYRDALYAMMLPSSCITAQCVARHVGKKILEKA